MEKPGLLSANGCCLDMTGAYTNEIVRQFYRSLKPFTLFFINLGYGNIGDWNKLVVGFFLKKPVKSTCDIVKGT